MAIKIKRMKDVDLKTSNDFKILVKFDNKFINNLNNTVEQTEKQLSENILKRCEEYVPVKIGTLKSSGVVKGTDVIWEADYAGYVYDKNFQLKGKRGPKWVERMIIDYRDEITTKAVEYMKKNLK